MYIYIKSRITGIPMYLYVYTYITIYIPNKHANKWVKGHIMMNRLHLPRFPACFTTSSYSRDGTCRSVSMTCV